jgi:hypothetical protein
MLQHFEHLERFTNAHGLEAAQHISSYEVEVDAIKGPCLNRVGQCDLAASLQVLFSTHVRRLGAFVGLLRTSLDLVQACVASFLEIVFKCIVHGDGNSAFSFAVLAISTCHVIPSGKCNITVGNMDISPVCFAASLCYSNRMQTCCGSFPDTHPGCISLFVRLKLQGCWCSSASCLHAYMRALVASCVHGWVLVMPRAVPLIYCCRATVGQLGQKSFPWILLQPMVMLCFTMFTKPRATMADARNLQLCAYTLFR